MPRRRPRAESNEGEGLSQGRWDDLYDRLTSRKFLMTLLAVAFAAWNYWGGRLTPEQFQWAVTAAIGTYVGAEGLVDFASGWGARKESARAEAELATARALEAHADLRRMGVPNPLAETRSVSRSLAAATEADRR